MSAVEPSSPHGEEPVQGNEEEAITQQSEEVEELNADEVNGNGHQEQQRKNEEAKEAPKENVEEEEEDIESNKIQKATLELCFATVIYEPTNDCCVEEQGPLKELPMDEDNQGEEADNDNEKEVSDEDDSDNPLVTAVSYFLPPIYSTVVKPPPLPPPDWPGAVPDVKQSISPHQEKPEGKSDTDFDDEDYTEDDDDRPDYDNPEEIEEEHFNEKLKRKLKWNKMRQLWGSVHEISEGAAKSFFKKVIPNSMKQRNRQNRQKQGQSGFEELRRFIKHGGDLSKDLAALLQERAEAEAQYSKTLGKLSTKLIKSTKEVCNNNCVVINGNSSSMNGGNSSTLGSSGNSTTASSSSIYSVWHRIGLEMEAQSEVHRNFATALTEEVVKPLKQLIDSQHRIRKSVETAVDKSCKSLSEWRTAESKAKKASFLCARENEKLRDSAAAISEEARSRLSSSSSLHLSSSNGAALSTGGSKTLSSNMSPTSEKLESKRRKAEELVKKADLEYYSLCLRAERSRLEWESAVIRGSHCFQVIEEERLKALKDLAAAYICGFSSVSPKLAQMSERMREPLNAADLQRDLEVVSSLRQATEPTQEQLLPDFYPEQISLAMNRDRRKQALIKLLQLIRTDLERERRGKAGVESLAQALKQTSNFSNEDSQQNVLYKLHHMRSMLTYLEAARYKVQSVLADLEGVPRISHPLGSHLHVSRDRQGYQQTVLKVPLWVHSADSQNGLGSYQGKDINSPIEWVTNGRGTADGTSAQPDSDFDEFSSQSSEHHYETTGPPSATINTSATTSVQVVNNHINNNNEPARKPHEDNSSMNPQKCRALYSYTANLYDELTLSPGDVINIHDKQPDGWWLGELNGTVGIFPATYVEEI